MTRADVYRDYKVSDEVPIIVSPGKFEGEWVWAPYFYDAMLNGDGEEEDDGWLAFVVGPEDLKEFPELDGVKWVSLYEREDGFVQAVALS